MIAVGFDVGIIDGKFVGITDGLPVGEIFTVEKSRLLVPICSAEAPLAFAKATNAVTKLPLEMDELNAFVNAVNIVSALLKPQLAALAIETL